LKNIKSIRRRKMYKILIPQDISESGKNYLLEKGYELKIGVPTDVESLKKEIADADGLIVRNVRYPKEVLEAGRKLKVVARHGTGVDNIAVDDATKLGIQVTNAPVSNINAVAEYTLSLIMALGCQLKTADLKTYAGDWKYRDEMPSTRRELKDSKLGIIGLGRVGSLVAKKAMNGLGMHVIAYNLVPVDFENPLFTKVKEMDTVLEEADFITVHVPSTPVTRNMFNYNTFCKMKESAYFINCARGDVYVEEDLCRALTEGVIRGAALDVYKEEPLSADSCLLKLNNVILSQHNSSLSKESTDNMALHAAIGVDEVLSGKVPTWPVNRLK